MKKINKILLILIASLQISGLLAGCGDAKDINAKRILTAVAMDYKNNEVYFYVEVANIEGGSTGEGKSASIGKKYITVIGHGKNITKAREDLDTKLDKQIYLSAIRTLIFTEDFAKEYLVEYLYRQRAEELYRNKAITVITKEDPEELFDNSNKKDESVGFTVEGVLATLDEAGHSFHRTTSRLIENLSNKYTGILVPCIGLKDNRNTLVGYSVVNGTTISGFIPVEESKGVIFLKKSSAKYYYIVPYKGNEFSIEVSLIKTKNKPSDKDGKIRFNLSFEYNAELKYGDRKTPYNFDESSKAKVAKTLKKMIKKDISEAVWQAQTEFECDYLQFDDVFRVKYPAKFEEMNWKNEFRKATVNIDVKVDLKSTWMMDYKTNKRK